MAASQAMNDLGSMGVSNVGIGKRDSKVTETMDVFSAGCVLLEMWTDGSGVFTLSELYAYREGNAGGLAMVLDSLQDPIVKVRMLAT
jgi:phosphoinositide-3-kinase, regulatory subunit 4